MQNIDHKKMGAGKILLIIAAAVVVAAITIYLTWDRIVIYFVAKQYNLAISYSSVKNMNFKELQFKDLKATEKKRGSGILALNAKLWPVIGVETNSSKSLTFELKGVKFIPSPKKSEKAHDYMMDIVGMPFSGNWAYTDIYGEISEHEKGIFIKKLVASGDAIRVSINGYLLKNDKVDINITIQFSKNLTKDLPDSLMGSVLKDEQGGWKSFSAHMSGDLSTPSIELSGKLFKLNIRQLSQ